MQGLRGWWVTSGIARGLRNAMQSGIVEKKRMVLWWNFNFALSTVQSSRTVAWILTTASSALLPFLSHPSINHTLKCLSFPPQPFLIFYSLFLFHLLTYYFQY